jgi:hypothetical protein
LCNNQRCYYGAGDVVVDEEANESTTLQTEDNVPREGAIVTESPTQVVIGEEPRNEVGEPKKWEIVKSIVYGGLVESITSLGIVSSAASSGATPCKCSALRIIASLQSWFYNFES